MQPVRGDGFVGRGAIRGTSPRANINDLLGLRVDFCDMEANVWMRISRRASKRWARTQNSN